MTAEDDSRQGDELDPRTRRILRTAGVVAGLAGIAGCSSLGDSAEGADGPDGADSPAETPDPGTATATPTDAGDEPDQRTDSATSTGQPTPAPTATRTETQTPTTSPTPTTTPCDTESLEVELSTLESDVESTRSDLAGKREEITRLLGVRSNLPGAWDGSVVSEAEATGLSIRPSVVALESDFGGGTGWYVDDTHVVTNAHVVGDARELTVYDVDGNEYSATLVNKVRDYHRNPDVAILEAEESGPPLDTGSADDLEPRTPVVHVGHPSGVGHWVTSLGHYLWTKEPFFRGADYVNLYTSVPGRSGVSGAPLVTLDGTVVGQTWGATQRGGGTPVDEAPEVADPLVRDWPLGARVWGQHNTIEAVERLYDRWT